MTHRHLTFTLLLLGLGVLFVMTPARGSAQDQCGELDTISYPIAREQFQLGQDFGTASPRHQGRYHTGEDWFISRNGTLGHPVRAVGRGLVTQSSPSAWGLDGGVVVIRHTLPDGSYVFSQYGHLQQTETTRFPARLSCVEAGDVIGVIGDARPAPHLHFEMRVFSEANPAIIDTPGPGYTWRKPQELGWRRPVKMVENLSAELSRHSRWRYTLSTFERTVPPFVLNDESLLVVDGGRLRRITSDGRSLWRLALPKDAVHLHGREARSFVIYSDGSVARVDVENAALQPASWSLPFEPDGPPLALDDGWLFHTADGALVATDDAMAETSWRLNDVPPFEHGVAVGPVIGLVVDGELWTVSREGELLDKARLEAGAALSAAPDGALVAYTQGGLWRINSTGTWSTLLEDVPPGGHGTAALLTEDGRVFLTNGTNFTAYNASGDQLWQARLPRLLTGTLHMERYDNVILVKSSHGDIVTVNAEGGMCGYGGLYGNDRTQMWHAQGDDGTLRLSIGDQLMGFDWEGLTDGC